MTKSTITREQTQQIIVAADEVITALAGTNEDVHPDDSKKMCELWDDLNDRHAPPVVVRELARMALAAMDSDPVAEVVSIYGDPEAFGEREIRPLVGIQQMPYGTKLYRHAQQPVVPDEAQSRAAFEKWCTVNIERNKWHPEFYAHLPAREQWAAWEACRAAILSVAPQSPGIEPATVPGKWIPVSERMPEDSGRYWCYVEEQNDLGKSHYQWNCSWNGDRWWVESDNGGIVTHWMPLPAAPQEPKP